MRHAVALVFAASLSSFFLSACTTTLKPVRDQTVTGSVEATSTDSAAQFIGGAADGMDEEARNDYLAAQTSALDEGTKATFRSEGMGVNGTVEVGPSSLTSLYPNMECRRYSSVVWVVGNGQRIDGDACRSSNGSWQAMGIHER